MYVCAYMDSKYYIGEGDGHCRGQGQGAINVDEAQFIRRCCRVIIIHLIGHTFNSIWNGHKPVNWLLSFSLTTATDSDTYFDLRFAHP